MKIILTLITALLLVGCAGKAPPDQNLYLLRSDSPNQFDANNTTATIAVGALRVASYIDQPGLVLETAEGLMNPARYNQWAEPLRESLRVVLANDIATAIGKPVRARSSGETDWKQHTDQTIDVSIEQLHGTDQGDAILVAYWAVINPATRSVVSEHQFSKTLALSNSGYPALIDAEKQLLKSLANDIAGSLE
jgi:uncharacterized lipoprotein YmbA